MVELVGFFIFRNRRTQKVCRNVVSFPWICLINDANGKSDPGPYSPLNGGEIRGVESHGIESVQNHKKKHTKSLKKPIHKANL